MGAVILAIAPILKEEENFFMVRYDTVYMYYYVCYVLFSFDLFYDTSILILIILFLALFTNLHSFTFCTIDDVRHIIFINNS